MHASLALDRTDHVAHLTLGADDRPRVSLAALEALREALATLADDPTLRVLTLAARGRDFGLGADLTDPRLAAAVMGGDEPRRALARLGREVIDALANFPVPTVVAARGRALGANACLFTACDFRFASQDASLGLPEVDRGMHLSWGILPRLVAAYGDATAKRLAIVGEPLGMASLGAAVTCVADPDAEAHTLAERLAAKPPRAVRAIVRVLRTGDVGLDDALFAETAGSADFAEAMSAFLQKRAPVFTGR